MFQRIRLAGKLEQANAEIALLREESRIKDARAARTSSVGRLLKHQATPPPATPQTDTLSPAPDDQPRVVTARYPNHVWHVDHTVVPTRAGFWIPWLPYAAVQLWPFAYWVAAVIDHYSRRVMVFAVFKHQPSSMEIRAFLGRAIHAAGQTPRHIIMDRGSQFDCDAFRTWCRRSKIKPRYGAVGKHGSIAIIERFIRSLKYEYTNQILVPLRMAETQQELACYINWYNDVQPHQTLGGRTPLDVYHNRASPAKPAAHNSKLPEFGRLRSFDQKIVLRMSADPDPDYVIVGFNAKRPAFPPDSHGVESADFLEVQRRMLRIFLEQFEIVISELANRLRQVVITFPEVRIGVVFYSRVHLLALKSLTACSARASNLPPRTSCSSCLSQACSSKVSNQERNECSSASGRCLTAFSISLTVVMR